MNKQANTGARATALIHHDYEPPAGFSSLQQPTYRASTVLFANCAAMAQTRWEDKTGYTYGLHGTPSTFVLEERIASLEGARHCLLAPSGLAAISLVNMALLQSGDELLLPNNAYAPAHALARHELARWGIRTQVYDPLKPAELAAKMNAQTKLLWLEAAGSITLEFPDLFGLVQTARATQPQALIAIDSTWGAGLAYQPFALPGGAQVDVSVQALTKYQTGAGDVLMGSVCTRDPATHALLRDTHMRLGLGVSGPDVELILRSLPTLALRYRAQDAACRKLAAWLQQQPEVAAVRHPALAASPGHAHWQQVCPGGNDAARGAASLLSVCFQPQYERAHIERFCDALHLFKLGYSWGGHLSLAMPYSRVELKHTRTDWAHAGELVRLYVGLEAEEDLRADLAQALRCL